MKIIWTPSDLLHSPKIITQPPPASQLGQRAVEASQHQQCWPPTLIDRRDSWTSVFLESTSLPHSVFLIAPLPTILSTGGRVGTSPWPTWPSVIFSGRRLFPNYSFLRHILKLKSCILWRNILSTYIYIYILVLDVECRVYQYLWFRSGLWNCKDGGCPLKSSR